MATIATPQTAASSFRGQPPPVPALPGQPHPNAGLPASVAVSSGLDGGSIAQVREAPNAFGPSSIATRSDLQMASIPSDPIDGAGSTTLGLPACFAGLPVCLEVSVPVREFRVRKLLALARGEIIETQWGHGEDLPLASAEVQLAWTEFEVVDTKLAVRITRLV